MFLHSHKIHIYICFCPLSHVSIHLYFMITYLLPTPAEYGCSHQRAAPILVKFSTLQTYITLLLLLQLFIEMHEQIQK